MQSLHVSEVKMKLKSHNQVLTVGFRTLTIRITFKNEKFFLSLESTFSNVVFSNKISRIFQYRFYHPLKIRF